MDLSQIPKEPQERFMGYLRTQRIKDGLKTLGSSVKELSGETGLNCNSLSTQLNTAQVGKERLISIEEGLIRLAKKKQAQISELVEQFEEQLNN